MQLAPSLLYLCQKAGRNREFMRRQTHGLTGNALINPIHLIENHTRPDYSDPEFWSSLSFAHACLRRFFGNRFVRKDSNPDFATTTDVAGHGDTSSLDLAACNPCGFQSLQRKLPEADLIPTTCLPSHPTPVLFTKFR